VGTVWAFVPGHRKTTENRSNRSVAGTAVCTVGGWLAVCCSQRVRSVGLFVVRTYRCVVWGVLVLWSELMLYREIIAVCSQIQAKHINTLCEQNVELLNVKLAVHVVTTGL
jgi:hypothetical protein